MLSRVLGLRHTQDNIVGLDIDSDYIKVLKINKETSPKQIEHYAVTPLPAGLIIKNEIKDQNTLAKFLETTLQKAGVQSKNMALAISRSSTIIKNITIDSRLTPDEIENRAWIEANHHFPDLVGESYLDFSVVGSSSKDPNQLELILVACRKDVIDPYLKLLASVGLIATIVDVNSFAFERALLSMKNLFSNNATTALLNLNSSISTLIVIHENKLIYAHDESFDTTRLQTKTREAGADIEKRQAVLKENLSAHLRHTMHFFYSTRPHITIEKLIISGNCTKDLDMVNFIETETGLATFLADPLADMIVNSNINEADLRSYRPVLVLCTGLALSHVD